MDLRVVNTYWVEQEWWFIKELQNQHDAFCVVVPTSRISLFENGGSKVKRCGRAGHECGWYDLFDMYCVIRCY